MHPTALPRGQARRSRDMARLHIVEGRMCHELTPSSPSLRIVIDTSGSMAGTLLANAISLAGAIYLSLSPSEQRCVEWFSYTTTIRRVQKHDVPHLCAHGGTSLACLQPLLDTSDAHDRWLVITDGAVPDLNRVSGKLALVVIGQRAPNDPRCIEWSNDLMHDRISLERACRRLQTLLR